MDEFSNIPEGRLEILKQVAIGNKSVIDISKKLNLSIPYVHQQITLLEAQGHLKRRIVKTKDVKKPRRIYDISKESAQIILIKNNFAKRFQISDNYFLTYLQILANLPSQIHTIMSKYYWDNYEDFSKIRAISFLGFNDEKVELFVLSDDKNLDELRKRISNVKLGTNKTMVCWVNTYEECQKGVEAKDSYYLSHITKAKVIVDDENLFLKLKEKI